MVQSTLSEKVRTTLDPIASHSGVFSLEKAQQYIKSTSFDFWSDFSFGNFPILSARQHRLSILTSLMPNDPTRFVTQTYFCTCVSLAMKKMLAFWRLNSS